MIQTITERIEDLETMADLANATDQSIGDIAADAQADVDELRAAIEMLFKILDKASPLKKPTYRTNRADEVWKAMTDQA